MTTRFQKNNEFVDNTPGEVLSETVGAAHRDYATARTVSLPATTSTQQLAQKRYGNAALRGEGGGVDAVE